MTHCLLPEEEQEQRLQRGIPLQKKQGSRTTTVKYVENLMVVHEMRKVLGHRTFMNSPAVGKSTSKKWSAEIIRCKEGNTFSVRHREGKDCISELLFFSTVCNADHIQLETKANCVYHYLLQYQKRSTCSHCILAKKAQKLLYVKRKKKYQGELEQHTRNLNDYVSATEGKKENKQSEP